MAEKKTQPTFPYVPFQTFLAFIRHLADNVVTDQIDNTMMPGKFSGSSRTWVTSALKSLKLIDAKNNTSPNLKELVDAYQGKDWAAKLKEHVLSIYTNIPESVDLKSVTPKQLEDLFPDMSQQMRDKSIRFFLAANKEAGIEYSPLLKRKKVSPRRRSETATRKRTKVDKQSQKPPIETPKHDKPASDMFELPIPIAPNSCIRVPRNITASQVALVKAAIGYLEAMAKQNEETTE